MSYKLVDTVHGRMLADLNDFYIGKSLDIYGEYSFLEWSFLDQFIQLGDHVLDVGANVGAHTLGFAKSVGQKGRVWAFEMQNMVFQNLCANINLNNLSNVYAYQMAVANREDYLYINDVKHERVNNYGGIALDQVVSNEAIQKLPMNSIDFICDKVNVSVIKVDVEGMELDVLQGAEKIIERSRPVLYLENDRQEKSEALLKHIFSLGYKVWKHEPPLFNAKNYRGIDENHIGNFISRNILCLPQEHQAEIIGLDEISSSHSAITQFGSYISL